MPPIPNFVDEWFIFFPLYLSFLLKNFKYQRQTIRFDCTFPIVVIFAQIMSVYMCKLKSDYFLFKYLGRFTAEKNNIRLTPRRGNSVSWNVETWYSQTKKSTLSNIWNQETLSFSLLGNFLQLRKGTNLMLGCHFHLCPKRPSKESNIIL